MRIRRDGFLLPVILVLLLVLGFACSDNGEHKQNKKDADTINQIEGLFVYWADAAIITNCINGEKLPVAMEKDYIYLEKAYLEKRKSEGQVLLVRFEGHEAQRPAIEGDNTERVVIVDKFIEVMSDTICVN